MTLSQHPSPSPAAKPGRPRNPATDKAILQSALKLLMERGYAGLSVERVAADAGVGKTTIYRRYESKEELAVAAVGALRDEMGPAPDTGCTKDDIVEMVVQNQSAMEHGPGFAMIGALLVEERRNPDLLGLFRERIIKPRRDDIVAVLQRGVDRGEVRYDIDLDIVVHAIMGSVLARHLFGATRFAGANHTQRRRNMVGNRDQRLNQTCPRPFQRADNLNNVFRPKTIRANARRPHCASYSPPHLG